SPSSPPAAGNSAEKPPAAPGPSLSPIVQKMATLYAQGNDDDAIATGDEWLKEHPGDPAGVEVRLATARALVRKGMALKGGRETYLQLAFNHLEAARVADPARLDVRIGICDVLYHLNRHDQLMEEIRSALSAHASDESVL